MLAILQWIQAWHAPWWDWVMVEVSNFYGKPVYILVALTYWWWPRQQARWMVALACGSEVLNTVLKLLVGTDRPADGVRHLAAKGGTGPAFPSGHTQGMAVISGALALMKQKRWLWWGSAIGMVLMGYSRMYTGFHWPSDVLGGAVLGVLVLWVWYSLWGKNVTTAALRAGQTLVAARSTWLWIVLLLALPALVGLLVDWSGLAASTDRESTQNVFTVMGLMAGFLAGSYAEERWVGFDPLAGRTGWQWAKLLVGAVVVGVFFLGGEVLLHGDGLVRYGRYAIDGLAATWLAPWVFTRLLQRQAGRRASAQA